MEKTRFWFILVGLSLLLGVVSCSKYQKLLKSDDHELKFTKAIEYFEAGQYSRTIGLLSDIIPVYRGTAKAEQINYYFAMAHYKMRDYTLASHYLRSFVTAFPNSEHAEEFLFLSAYSKYLESPRPSLDQSFTVQAIQELQGFINRFPESHRVEEANKLIDELRFKLETKRFDTAMMYFRIGDYIAAVTTFDNLIMDFPDTRFREEALFRIVLARFEFANQSIYIRQKERFEDVTRAFQRLVRFFPESQFLDRAERLNNIARERIEELQAITNGLEQ